MKRLSALCLILLIGCCGLLAGARLAGQRSVEWPIRISYRQPLPTEPPFDAVLPERVAAFRRAQISIPLGSIRDGSRLITWGAAEYTRPGDLNRVTLQVRQFSSAQVAALLIDPANLWLHSATSSVFYSLAAPIRYKFSAVHNDYDAYELDYVSGAWNVLISCTSDQTLLAFANQYPF